MHVHMYKAEGFQARAEGFWVQLSAMPFLRCTVCQRRSEFYGHRDIATGWVGWCQVCNWKWRYGDAPGDAHRALRFRVLPRLHTEVQSAVIQFLCAYTEIRQLWLLHRGACIKYWRLLLLGNYRRMLIYDRQTGAVRDASTDDEDEDGVLPETLNWVNRMEHLAMAEDVIEDANWHCDRGRPLQIVISFLMPLCIQALVLTHQ